MNTIENKTDTRERIRILSERDLTFSYFCGSGAGGQARNKVHTGVQIRHEESGAIGRASDSRSQDQNKRSAFLRLCEHPKMKFWLARKLFEIREGEKLEAQIEREASGKNCKYEIRNPDGRWEEVPLSYFDGEAAKEQTKD